MVICYIFEYIEVILFPDGIGVVIAVCIIENMVKKAVIYYLGIVGFWVTEQCCSFEVTFSIQTNGLW
jgi:hypothetical protein